MKALVINAITPLMITPSFETAINDEVLAGWIVETIVEGIQPQSVPANAAWQEEWVFVETHYKVRGYVHKSNLCFDPERIELWQQERKLCVMQAYADVLSESKIQGYNIQSLTRGALVIPIAETITQDNVKWTEVLTPNGKQGFIKSQFLIEYKTTYSLANERQLRQDLLNTALSYLGVQYRWGGKSTLGLDCSGFTHITHLINGIIIHRNSKYNENFSVKKIELLDLGLTSFATGQKTYEASWEEDLQDKNLKTIQPADLLYFKGHIAIYLGDNKYLHSSSTLGKVSINSLNPHEPDYRALLMPTFLHAGTLF
jgi:beta-lactamase class A